MSAEVVPNRGDVVWASLSPAKGHEQAGHRPLVVLSREAYNARAGLVLCVPVTRTIRRYPFEVPLPPTAPVQGVVLADQLRVLDWRERGLRVEGRVPDESMLEILGRARALLE